MNLVNTLKNPTAFVAKEIENLVITSENHPNSAVQLGCGAAARFSPSFTLFPTSLTAELLFKRIPDLLFSVGDSQKFNKKWEKVTKFGLGLLCTPLGMHRADGVSGLFFAETPDASRSIRPFGVEEQFGRKVDKIYYPTKC